MDLRTAKSLSPPEYHARRAASRHAAREALRQRKLREAREAIRFRHVFRAAYSIDLDPERMALVLRKALALREHFPRRIEGFLTFLESLES
ncbi:MAG: hypothetical protein GY856_17955 [bacterium]|nr:hypothetical protein [bacterium]